MLKLSEVMAMVEECKQEEEKTKYIPHYYKRNGEMLRRRYDDVVYTKRYEELFFDEEHKTLRSNEAKIFKCEECKEYVGYWDLEDWCCSFSENPKKAYYICSCCYENGMGEDL